jgi:hypothetical protein
MSRKYTRRKKLRRIQLKWMRGEHLEPGELRRLYEKMQSH